MYPVSAEYLAALKSYAQFTPECELSWDGRDWYPLLLNSGRVTADRTSQIRYACNLKVIADPVLRDSPYGARIRVFSTVTLLRGQSFRIPLGVYRVDDNKNDSDGMVGVTGSGREIECQEALFLTPRQLPRFPGQTIRQATEELIREAVPDARFRWDLPGDREFPGIVEESDRWSVLDGGPDDSSFAKALGAETYCDARGTFVIRGIPGVEQPVAWTVDQGSGGVLVAPSRTQSRIGVANVWVVTGTRDDGRPPVGPGIAWDDEPTSPLYAGPDPVNRPDLAGPFGIKPQFYSSPLITDPDQCVDVARALLRAHRGLRRTVTFSAVNNPALEPGDVVAIEVNEGHFEHHLLDTLTFELGTGVVQGETRMVES